MVTYKIIEFDPNIGQLKVIVNEYDFGIIPVNLIPDAAGRYPTGAELDNYIKGFLPAHELDRLNQVKTATNANEILALVEPLPLQAPPVPSAADSTQLVFVV